MLGARISHVLTPGAEKLDELFGKILGSAGSVSQGVLAKERCPFAARQGRAQLRWAQEVRER